MDSNSARAVRRLDPTNLTRPKLYTMEVCPFAQRARIACYHLSIEYEKIEIDTDNKPAELFMVNPRGLVPAIDDQGFCIYESEICCLYLEETWESPTKQSLLPKDPKERALLRLWVDYIGKEFVPEFYRYLLSQDQDKQKRAEKAILTALSTLSQAMLNISLEGPFLLGKEFGMFEIMLAPFVERFSVLKHYRDFVVPNTEEYARFHVWCQALEKHPTFTNTRVPEEVLMPYYVRYANNTARSKVADAIREGKELP